mmetsp:Transcript_112792/g.206993  ORF Transcript_112792/g.206993 Transcript_112792/m.206993 type:complete len:334 (-) Transcript_112792:1189-2190(-)
MINSAVDAFVARPFAARLDDAINLGLGGLSPRFSLVDEASLYVKDCLSTLTNKLFTPAQDTATLQQWDGDVGAGQMLASALLVHFKVQNALVLLRKINGEVHGLGVPHELMVSAIQDSFRPLNLGANACQDKGSKPLPSPLPPVREAQLGSGHDAHGEGTSSQVGDPDAGESCSSPSILVQEVICLVGAGEDNAAIVFKGLRHLQALREVAGNTAALVECLHASRKRRGGTLTDGQVCQSAPRGAAARRARALPCGRAGHMPSAADEGHEAVEAGLFAWEAKWVTPANAPRVGEVLLDRARLSRQQPGALRRAVDHLSNSCCKLKCGSRHHHL